MNRLITNAVSYIAIACATMTSVADAQIVRVGAFGGVSVRAPFVSIDTLPFGGGTRVRAPFTSVNTRAYSLGYGSVYRPYGFGYRYDRPYRVYDPILVYPTYPVPVYPAVPYSATTSVPLQTGPYQTVRPSNAASGNASASLRASAQQLKRSLSIRRDDADIWIGYLEPDRIIATIDAAGPPDSLRLLLLNYEGVIGNPTLESIQRATGFNETHRLLKNFVNTKTTPMSDAAPSSETTAGDGEFILEPVP